MEQLLVIKVTIGLKSEKGRQLHDFPNFNKIRDSVSGWDFGLDWAHYVDQFGGWKYDSVCGHQDEDETSPRGVWFGILCVPEEFAEAAIEKFPDQVEVLNESECQEFYEQRHTVGQPSVFEDAEVLQAIASKRQAGLDEEEDDRNAMDIDHPARGRRRNKLKTWEAYKKQRGIEIDAAATQRIRNGA